MMIAQVKVYPSSLLFTKLFAFFFPSLFCLSLLLRTAHIKRSQTDRTLQLKVAQSETPN